MSPSSLKYLKAEYFLAASQQSVDIVRPEAQWTRRILGYAFVAVSNRQTGVFIDGIACGNSSVVIDE